MRADARGFVTLWLGFASVMHAQTPRRDSIVEPVERMTITPSTKYRAGWLRRWVLGADYRSLWATPIDVEVLNLKTEAGGLRATQRGGSMQTNALRFAGANGREYVFRPLEKDFSKGLPVELRESLVRDIAQDQVSGYHPGAALVVASLLDATGLHHPRPRLVVMPNDSSLGEFRAEFAGVLGTIEERPGSDFDETPESSGAIKTISSERLFERMLSSSDNIVDARAFLSARLFDILVGDRDRHRDQWRWGRFSEEKDAPWEPIPRDRDMPFAKFDGIGPWALRGVVPQLVTFGDRYPDMVWLNWNAREIDRRLLVSLEWPAWDSAATALQGQMSDAVIDGAIAQMPPAFVLDNGRQLHEMLVRRRERLADVAREYYRVLAREVDFSATDDADFAEVTRFVDGSVAVSIAHGRSSGGQRTASTPYLRRHFDPADTREVRLFLHGGNDRVIVRGAPTRRILIRVIGGHGDDAVTDSIPGGDHALRFYDSSGFDFVSGYVRTRIDHKPYTPPKVERPEDAVRDWGAWSYTLRNASYSPGVGLLLSLSHDRFTYGFRGDPYASRSTLRADLSVGERRPRVIYDAAFREPNSDNTTTLRVLASGIELIRYHGLGNETGATRGTRYYRVFQNVFRVEPAFTFALPIGGDISLGPVGQYSATREGARTLLSESKPYGSGRFGEVGARLGLSVDRRDAPAAPRRGFRLSAGGTFYPALWNVDRAFGDATVTASSYLSTKSTAGPTLALRAGGEHVWGTFPFHDAAYLGGVNSLRGWDEQRFAGRSAIFGNAELRARVAKLFIIVPTEFGILAFADAGRVYADGESSEAWHTAQGGGLWIAPLMRSNTVSLSVAKGRERWGLYLRTGFAF